MDPTYELVFTRNGCTFWIQASQDTQDQNIDVLAESLADTLGAHYLYKEELNAPVQPVRTDAHDKLAIALAEVVRLRLKLGLDPHTPIEEPGEVS